MRTLQFTIPASGIIQLDYPGNFRKANSYYQQITIQNNNAGNLRIGDSSISATVGILLYPTSSFTITAPLSHRAIQEIYVYGVVGSLVDVLLLE
jgi:hypothetical protein